MECFFQLIHALPLNPRLWPDHDLSKCFMLKVFARTNVENLRNELWLMFAETSQNKLSLLSENDHT